MNPKIRINKDYLENNFENIIECYPVLPTWIYNKISSEDKRKKALNLVYEKLVKQDQHYLNYRYKLDKYPNESRTDYDLRKIQEFINNNPQHSEVYEGFY